MTLRLALLLVAALFAAFSGPRLSALQRASEPRQVAVAWLTAKTIAEAFRHLPPSTVEQFTTFQKAAKRPEQEAIANMVEPMLAPLVFSQLMGGKLKTTGAPVSTIIVSDNHEIHITVLNVSVTGDAATVPLRIRATAGGPAEAGGIELRRDGAVWRIVAANLGSKIPLARFDSPNYLDVATMLAIDELRRERGKMADAMVIGRLRSLMSAQFTYAAFNGGFFAPPECLTEVAKCKPPFKLDPSPLPADVLELRGYASRFYPGSKPSASDIAMMKAVAQSLKSWAHVFSPTDDAAKGAAFCGDSTGRVCRLPAGRSEITGGACPAACADWK